MRQVPRGPGHRGCAEDRRPKPLPTCGSLLSGSGVESGDKCHLSVNCVVTRSKPERDVGPVVSNWVGREDLHDERTLGQTLKEVKEGAMQLWGSSYHGAETVA